MNMKHRSIHLLDLPDELLLIIMKKLKHNDILYSLLGVNKRLDRLAGSKSNTLSINFTSMSSTDEHICMDHELFNQFCFYIMPRICHNVCILILDHWSMERVLLACEYPILQSITFSYFQSDIFLNCLKDGSPIARLFKEQITYIHVVNTKGQKSNNLFTDACARIFALCTKLKELNAGGFGVHVELSIYNRPPNTCLSSNLSVLSIVVTSFDDCLCLLDGRLNKLVSFSVKIDVIGQIPSAVDNTKLLPNLKLFSIISYLALGYDDQVLPLLRRMPNLKDLTLDLTVIRLALIDGIHLDKEILSHLSQLTKFIFHIRTAMPLLDSHHHLLAHHVQNTFSHWKYGQVNSHVDYIPDNMSQCHIYSVPFQMARINGVTNSFFGNSFHRVIVLNLTDVRPFEHIYFNWIALAFPLLKYLSIDNLTPQEHKDEIEAVNDNQNSTIYFPRLMIISLINAHIDYVDQFLRHTKLHVPCLSTLEINYGKLVTVTNNFTSDLTRINCAQLKRLCIGEEIVYPKDFYLYFPFL